MNQIQKSNNQLTVGDAARGDLAPQLVEDIATRIGEAAIFRGYDIPKPDLTVMAQTYLADLRQYFGGLDLAEITFIIRSGIRKEWGEFYGLNAGTLYDWTCAYMRSEKREEYLAKKREKANAGRMLAQKNEKSPADIFAELRDSVNKHYAEYCEMLDKREASREEQPGGIGSILEKSMPKTVGAKRYPIGHPLCDLGSHLCGFLHDNGFTGTLKEIFDNARSKGQKEVL
jgi:hypothetical protein